MVGTYVLLHGSLGVLFTSRIAGRALRAKGLSTRALPKILGLNVIASVALCVVVMDILLHRMPRSLLRHFAPVLRKSQFRYLPKVMRYGNLLMQLSRAVPRPAVIGPETRNLSQQRRLHLLTRHPIERQRCIASQSRSPSKLYCEKKRQERDPKLSVYLEPNRAPVRHRASTPIVVFDHAILASDYSSTTGPVK